LVVTGSTGCSTSDCREAAALVASGRVNLHPLIGERFPLFEAESAFEAARGTSGLKVILEPGYGPTKGK